MPGESKKPTANEETPVASSGDQGAIEEVMARYNAALNEGKTSAVLPLYMEDGIFMPPYSPSAIGQAAVEKAYDEVFKELNFDVKFDIAELVQMAQVGIGGREMRLADGRPAVRHFEPLPEIKLQVIFHGIERLQDAVRGFVEHLRPARMLDGFQSGAPLAAFGR